MKNIIISGSIAYDDVCQFDGYFEEVISKENLKNLSVCFLIKEKETYFGGCAGNIAYNLKLLDENGVIFGVAGNDFEKYEKWLAKNEISDKEIRKILNKETAKAIITTDKKGNQITCFYPGASLENPEMLLENYKNKDSIAIISPDNVERMKNMSFECQRLGIPYIFDPGQQIPAFEKEDLINCATASKGIILNEYEYSLLEEKTGLKLKNMVNEGVEFIIVTLGEKGSKIITSEKTIEIKSANPEKIIDPTGCGDAYRAGILKGLKQGFDFEKTGKIGALIATFNLEEKGTQNHHFTMEEFKERFKKEFNEEF